MSATGQDAKAGRRRSAGALGALLLLCGLPGGASQAQAPGAGTLIIEGATLIDGAGGAPVADSAVVIRDGRIAVVGRRGEVARPVGARVINARGQFLTPGLIDSKANYASSFGEAYLIWGVTTAVVSGGSGDAGMAERDAINHGVFPGPRLALSYGQVGGQRPDATPPPTIPGSYNYPARNAAEARALAIQFLDAGADFLAAGSGQGSPEVFAAVVEEAHKRGKAATLHTGGLFVRGAEAAPMGYDVFIHGGHMGHFLAKDPAKWKDFVDRRPDPFADMDEAKIPAAIKLLIDNKVALEPDLIAMARGFPKNWARVQAEAETFYADPALRAYSSPQQIRGVIENVKSPETYMDPAALDVRRRGSLNYFRFLKALVDAGGRITPASDIPESPPGLGVHQEMAVFQEDVGMTPMQVLQSGTQWAAEAWKLNDRGVIAPGKLADLILVTADPTVDILNLRKIAMVIKDGKPVDRRYHADYLSKTFKIGMYENGGCCFSSPIVEGIGFTGGWVNALKQATWRPNSRNGDAGGVGGIDSELSPTPGIEDIAPYVVQPGSPATVLTVKGFNFVNRSQVLVDGRPVPTQVVSRTELRATLSAATLAKPGRPVVRVKNPAPLGNAEWGDTSNPAKLTIPYRFP